MCNNQSRGQKKLQILKCRFSEANKKGITKLLP
jgi:hypothetical protein